MNVAYNDWTAYYKYNNATTGKKWKNTNYIPTIYSSLQENVQPAKVKLLQVMETQWVTEEIASFTY